MKEVLKYLTQINPPRNYKNIASLNEVANYLKERFAQIGLATSLQEYIVGEEVYKNVIGTLNPHISKKLIVGAHYDVCGDTQGADDNASAVAGVVETAKRLWPFRKTIPFCIEFVCFSLEESPFFKTPDMGSARYVSLLSQKDAQVLGMINYEMIGYFTEEKMDISLFSHFITTKNAPIDKGNFIAIVADEQSRDFMSMFRFANIENEIQHIEAVLPPQIVPIAASDHLNFWENGYKAIMVTDTAHFRNPNYHTKNDTLDTLDLEKMSHVVDLIVEGIKNMALAHD